MKHCKKIIIAACLTWMLPLTAWSEALVVDDSDRFAMNDGQQEAMAPVVSPKYEEPARVTRRESYNEDNYQSDDEQALVRDDQSRDDQSIDTRDNVSNSAKLIDKVQNLQQEIQELRGQLEVQAHDLKLLQQQQLAFYKDLDARLGSGAGKSAAAKSPVDLSVGSPAKASAAPAAPTPVKAAKTSTVAAPAVAVSRANPADEQISYMAAYELVTQKQYDEAIKAMQIFVQKYPNGGYTANAQYWLGELYLVRKEYSEAIDHFETVLQQFPSSSKSAASLLKTGYAYAASGNTEEAKKRLQQVMRNYPDTPTAQLAATKLESINAL